MQTIDPAAGHLFLELPKVEKKTKSGFLLGEAAAINKPKYAIVVNIGAGVTGFSAHDRVIYKSYAASEIELNDETYLIVAADDILGKILDVEEE